jgi:hypothetical protein|tara:strand:- start:128 stop:331 length:204 start_codon:yes stop_codon:yes gene_type:complete
MDEPDYEIAVLATMSEAIRRLTKASGKTENEQLLAIATTAASICLNMMLRTQRQPASLHSMDGGKMQ